MRTISKTAINWLTDVVATINTYGRTRTVLPVVEQVFEYLQVPELSRPVLFSIRGSCTEYHLSAARTQRGCHACVLNLVSVSVMSIIDRYYL